MLLLANMNDLARLTNLNYKFFILVSSLQLDQYPSVAVLLNKKHHKTVTQDENPYQNFWHPMSQLYGLKLCENVPDIRLAADKLHKFQKRVMQPKL